MAPHTPGPLRTIGVLLRALAGLALLLALIAGVPYALLAIGHQPTELSGGLDLLLRQDDGTLFLVVITLLGWGAWAAFTLSALVELVAVLRRRSAPRIRGLSGMQSLASFLIGGIVLLAPTAASAATATHAAAVSVTQSVTQGESSPSASASSAAAADDTHWLTHTVTSPTESPWDLAEHYLGAGQRWKDIAALNPEIPALAAGDGYLPQGAVIKLPADARPTTPSTSSTPSADPLPTTQAESREQTQATPINSTTTPTTARTGPAAPTTYVVVPDDSLTRIAQERLGDADQWPKIYDLNRGHLQPGGHHLTDPDLIYPGEHLKLPAAAGTTPPSAPVTPHPQQKPSAPTEQAPTHAPTEHPAPAPSTTAPDSPQPSPSTQLPQPSATPSVPATRAPAPNGVPSPATSVPAGTTTAESTATGSRMPVYALGGGLLAAALLTLLATRRKLQQRRRRPGRRVPLPTGSAAATESALRATENPDGAEFIDAALRTAAVHLAAAGRELPELAAVVYAPATGLLLHLVAAAAPVPPFVVADEDLRRWHCPADTTELLEPADTRTVDAPYPALVTLGGDAAGHTVLVDLECYGAVQITGPDRLPVLRALAVELATSPYADHLDIAALGDAAFAGLPALLPEWFAAPVDVASTLRAVAAHHTDQQQALAAVGADSLRQARLGEDGAASWTPYLLLAADDLSQHGTHAQLAAIADAHPRTATVIITTNDPGTGATALPSAWTIDASPAAVVRLPGTDIVCTPQALSDQDYADVLELLTLSDEAAPDVPARPVPAPAVAVESGPAEPQQPAVAVPAPYHRDPRVHARITDDDSVLSPTPSLPSPLVVPDANDLGGIGQDNDRGLLAGLADFGGDLDDEPEPTFPDTGETTPAGSPIAAPRAAAEPAPEPEAKEVLPGPVIQVLGPVDVEGAQGTLETKHRRTLTELAAWMVLHPGLDHRALDEALWPGKDVDRKSRNPWISRLRGWLGTSADGAKHLPLIANTDDARYRFADTVSCDWHRFQNLVAVGKRAQLADGDAMLRTALELVRGRPFAAVPPRRYHWAGHLAQDMIDAIIDAAATLAERRLQAADPRSALWAATKGLDVAMESERLHRLAFQAHHALGDYEGLERAATQLEKLCDELHSDMEDATAELLRTLLTPA
ncbi:LysM peptidoglycan-binding domain-containing protein [Streptomyces sp. H39-S7]|uniref:LysM peptidoglycan-binding domain-containing protein n=1 Tax=Streptomyces sp. H39-S7 TaxID=3004357 RepID=UPI0022AEA5BC|nr:LysM peptidoglycan-binding domain-containing protein [Streptomyces sp. H39-S7]MCZ4125764.1 LysM peptidoglycan-binding domain-containing protein [Streptomyces sp. H39-S7]